MRKDLSDRFAGRNIVHNAELKNPGPVWDGAINRRKYAQLAQHFQRKAWRTPETLERGDYERLRHYNYLELWQEHRNRLARDQSLLRSERVSDAEKSRIWVNQESEKVWLEARKMQFMEAGMIELYKFLLSDDKELPLSVDLSTAGLAMIMQMLTFPPAKWAVEPPSKKGFFETNWGKAALAGIAGGTLITGLGSTAAAAVSADAARTSANSSIAANANTTRPGGPIVLQHSG